MNARRHLKVVSHCPKILTLALFLTLTSCVVTDTPLIADSNADTPFPDGATITGTDKDGIMTTASMHLAGKAYVIPDATTKKEHTYYIKDSGRNFLIVQAGGPENNESTGSYLYFSMIKTGAGKYVVRDIPYCNELKPGESAGLSVKASSDNANECRPASFTALVDLAMKDFREHGAKVPPHVAATTFMIRPPPAATKP